MSRKPDRTPSPNCFKDAALKRSNKRIIAERRRQRAAIRKAKGE